LYGRHTKVTKTDFEHWCCESAIVRHCYQAACVSEEETGKHDCISGGKKDEKTAKLENMVAVAAVKKMKKLENMAAAAVVKESLLFRDARCLTAADNVWLTVSVFEICAGDFGVSPVQTEPKRWEILPLPVPPLGIDT
jgi:hypothetical protein